MTPEQVEALKFILELISRGNIPVVTVDRIRAAELLSKL